MPGSINGDVEAGLVEIGLELGLTRERARQIQRDALQHARELLVERLGLDAAQGLARDEPKRPPITRRNG